MKHGDKQTRAFYGSCFIIKKNNKKKERRFYHEKINRGIWF